MNGDTNISKPSGSTLGWGNFPIYGTAGGGSLAPTPLPGQLPSSSGVYDQGGNLNLPNYFNAVGQQDPLGQASGGQTQSPGQYTKPAGWSDAQWNAWLGQTKKPTTPTSTPTTTPTTTDPFTSWLSQQNVFPYTQSTLGMSGWNPSAGYNPAASGYNPGAMPNYTIDTYP